MASGHVNRTLLLLGNFAFVAPNPPAKPRLGIAIYGARVVGHPARGPSRPSPTNSREGCPPGRVGHIRAGYSGDAARTGNSITNVVL